MSELADLLKGLPEESGPIPNADLPTSTFLQKLVAPEILRVHPSVFYDDYLKGLVALDCFALTLVGDLRILDNLGVITTELARRRPKPMLSLGLLLVECGLLARELPPDHFRRPDLRRRYDARDSAGTPRPADPYYQALAALVANQVRPPARARLARAATRSEVKALVFADAALALTGTAPPADPPDACAFAIAAAESLRDFATRELFHRHFEETLRR